MGQIKPSQIRTIEKIQMVVVAKMDTNPFCFADSCRLKTPRGSEYNEINLPLSGSLGCSQKKDNGDFYWKSLCGEFFRWNTQIEVHTGTSF